MAIVLPREERKGEGLKRAIGQGLGNLIETGTKAHQTRADEMALQKSISSLGPNATPRQILDAVVGTHTYGQEAKREFMKNAMGVSALEETQRHNKATEENASNAKAAATQAQELKAQTKIEEAKAKEDKAKEIQDKIIEVRKQPGFDEKDEVGQYRALQEAGVPTVDAEREAKLTGSKKSRESEAFNKSYDAQKAFIDKTTGAYKAFTSETEPKLKLISKLATDEDLISPTANTFRESLGIPLGALDNPNNELFQKTSLDLLKGLPETYGNRILKVEVDNFLKTVPTLENSPEGRRMIASNLLKLGEMKKVYFDEMRRQQKQYIEENKPFPRDFEQSVLEHVQPQIDRINNDFIKMSEIKHIPKGTVPFFNPQGEIEFVDKEHEKWASENGGRRIW